MGTEQKELRIGLIADLHYGHDRPTRQGTRALALLQDCIQDMNQEFRADLIFDLGDRIQDFSQVVDYKKMEEVKGAYEALAAPVYFLLGNHDLRYLTKQDNRTILGQTVGYRSFEYEGYRFFLLDGQDPTIEGIGGAISRVQLGQFRIDLEKSSLPGIVLVHQPLNDQGIEGNPLFQDIEDLAYISNRQGVLEIILASKGIIGVINGHVHWAREEHIQGISFISVPSFIESWQEDQKPQLGYAKVWLNPLGMKVEFSGSQFLRQFGQRTPRLHGEQRDGHSVES